MHLTTKQTKLIISRVLRN